MKEKKHENSNIQKFKELKMLTELGRYYRKSEDGKRYFTFFSLEYANLEAIAAGVSSKDACNTQHFYKEFNEKTGKYDINITKEEFEKHTPITEEEAEAYISKFPMKLD
jgi:hypothetical protein